MPEWLDIVMWYRALALWQLELVLAAMLMSGVAVFLLTRVFERVGPDTAPGEIGWVVRRYGIKGLWAVTALYWAVYWALFWLLLSGPFLALFLLLASGYAAFQGVVALRRLHAAAAPNA